MPWEFRWEGASVRVDELPIQTLIDVQQDTGVPWFQLLDAPLRDAAGGLALARKCAESAGVTLPDGLNARQYLDLFEVVEDDLPVEYTDGAPDPKEGGSSTRGSSGARSGSGGPPA